MKRFISNRKLLFSAAAILLVLGMQIPRTMAYFTTYVKAEGGYPITLGSTTTIKEEVKDMAKFITLQNTGEKECYVRVKVFAGNQFTVSFSGSDKWEQGDDGCWYYSSILQPGEETEVLKAQIQVPADFEESFNIVVVQECTEVLYNADGTPYADWNRLADSKTDIGTAEIKGADD